MRKILAVLASAVLTACGGGGGSDEPGTPAEPQKVKVYLMAGQSNMAGADALVAPTNGVQDLVDTGEQTVADRSARFTFATQVLRYEWGDIRGHAGYWLGDPTIEGKTVKVIGPEVGFNRELGGNTVIIKYADNFTALEGGRSPWVKPGTRWTAWQRFVDAQLATLGKPYEVAGFVWFQGIDDGLLKRDRASYEADLRQVAADLRTKYGAKPLVVIQEINSVIATPEAMAPIRAAQAAMGGEPGNSLVSVDDLPLATPHHLTGASQLVVGQRTGAAMRALQR